MEIRVENLFFWPLPVAYWFFPFPFQMDSSLFPFPPVSGFQKLAYNSCPRFPIAEDSTDQTIPVCPK